MLLSIIPLTRATFVERRIHLKELEFSLDALAHYILFGTSWVPVVAEVAYYNFFC